MDTTAQAKSNCDVCRCPAEYVEKRPAKGMQNPVRLCFRHFRGLDDCGKGAAAFAAAMQLIE